MSIHIYVRTHIIHIMICIYIYCLFVYTYTHIAYCTCECTWLMYIYIYVAYCPCECTSMCHVQIIQTMYMFYGAELYDIFACVYICVCVLYTYLWFFLFSYDKNNMYVHYIDIVRVTISYLCWYHLSINDFLYRWILPHVCVYVYIYNVHKILH